MGRGERAESGLPQIHGFGSAQGWVVGPLASTVHDDILPVWYWLILLSYCFTETTATTIYRILFVKKWYGAHRSHAYQNLARVLKNHSIVTNGVIIYHLLWLLPLAISSVLMPEFKFLAVLLAFLPSIIWTIKFVPLFSMD